MEDCVSSDIYFFGYADDMAAVINARKMEESQQKLNQVRIRTIARLGFHGL